MSLNEFLRVFMEKQSHLSEVASSKDLLLNSGETAQNVDNLNDRRINTEDAMRNYAIEDPSFMEFAMYMTSVMHGRSDTAHLGSAATCKNGYANLRNFPQFKHSLKIAIDKGWVVEHPTDKGWFTIRDKETNAK